MASFILYERSTHKSANQLKNVSCYMIMLLNILLLTVLQNSYEVEVTEVRCRVSKITALLTVAPLVVVLKEMPSQRLVGREI